MSDLSWLSRTTLLVGKKGVDKLQQAHVLVVGLGGVGSYAAEAIARSGVGKMTIVDGDIVDPSNRNRQLPALSTTHGMSKAALMQERIMAINPDIQLTTINTFLTPEKVEELLAKRYSYIIDAIDSLTPKVTLLSTAYYKNMRIVSSMGAGGKMDPTRVQVTDIGKTKICNLAYMVRKRLRYKGVYGGIKAVYSAEPALKSSLMLTDGSNFKKSAFGTISYLPAVFGFTCASVVIRDLVEWKEKK
ncbi:MAG: ThiF family adenylyltransferase [Bacteroidota bacterium]|jgi:tRNA A37 threonylcarbamoyladenosine dehydratase